MTFVPASSHGNVLTPAAAAALAAGPPAVILGSSAAGVSHTGDTNDFLLASAAIPANTIGLGQVEVEILFTITNNGNNKTIRIRFGPANDLTGTAFYAFTTSGTAGLQGHARFANRSTNLQVNLVTGASSGYGTVASPASTMAIDTTAQTFVVIDAQLANAADTVKLESYFVRLIPAV